MTIANDRLDTDPLLGELRAAAASLVLAIASADNADWAAAEQGVIDVEQRIPTILREMQFKLAEPPTVGGGEVDD
jgi:hypothetical protein